MPPTTQASPQSTLPASTISESWLPIDSEARKNRNCNASDGREKMSKKPKIDQDYRAGKDKLKRLATQL
jgi:hypothetical protein